MTQMIQPHVHYQHFKGTTYKVLHLALHSETEEPLVVYQSSGPDSRVWVRPEAMWNEEVEWPDGVMRPRFCSFSELVCERCGNGMHFLKAPEERVLHQDVALRPTPKDKLFQCASCYYTTPEAFDTLDGKLIEDNLKLEVDGAQVTLTLDKWTYTIDLDAKFPGMGDGKYFATHPLRGPHRQADPCDRGRRREAPESSWSDLGGLPFPDR